VEILRPNTRKNEPPTNRWNRSEVSWQRDQESIEERNIRHAKDAESTQQRRDQESIKEENARKERNVTLKKRKQDQESAEERKSRQAENLHHMRLHRQHETELLQEHVIEQAIHPTSSPSKLQEVETQEEAQHDDTQQHEPELAAPSQSAKNGWNYARVCLSVCEN
jgi:hypothetical protein